MNQRPEQMVMKRPLPVNAHAEVVDMEFVESLLPAPTG